MSGQLKNPLTSNAYLNALVKTSKNNDITLQQEKASRIQHIKSAQKKLKISTPLISPLEQAIKTLKAKKTFNSAFIPDYGYLDVDNLHNRNLNGVLTEINTHRLINQHRELRPMVNPEELLSRDEKIALYKERQNLPHEQKKLLEDILNKPIGDNTEVVKELKDLSTQLEEQQLVQIDNQKLNDLLNLLTPAGQEEVLNAFSTAGYSRNDASDLYFMIQSIKTNLSNPNFQQYLKKYNDDQQRLLQYQQQQQQQYQQLQQEMLYQIQRAEQRNLQEFQPSASASSPITPVPINLPAPTPTSTPASFASARSITSMPSLGSASSQSSYYIQAQEYYGPKINAIVTNEGPQQAINNIDEYIEGQFTDMINEDRYSNEQSTQIYNYLINMRTRLENQLGVRTQAPQKPTKIVRHTPVSPYKPSVPVPIVPASAMSASASAEEPVIPAQAPENIEQLFNLQPKQKKAINTWDEIRRLDYGETIEALENIGLQKGVDFESDEKISTLKSLLNDKIKESKQKALEEKLEKKKAQAPPEQKVVLTPLNEPKTMTKKQDIYMVLKNAGVQLNPLEYYKLDELKTIYKREQELRKKVSGKK